MNLIEQNLIDEHHLFRNHFAIGNGVEIFNKVRDKLNLKLVHSKASNWGMVNHYENISE